MTARRPQSTTAIATIEFWSRGKPPPTFLALLETTRPKPFIRPDEAWEISRRIYPARRGAPDWMCRFCLCRQTKSKTRPFAMLTEWGNTNKPLIIAARRHKIDIVAAIEVFNRSALYNVPIDADTTSTLAKLGIPLTVCVQASE